MRKEIDKSISAIVLAALAVIWLILLITSHVTADAVNGEQIMRGIGIAQSVILGLTYFVLLYNAWGWSNNIIVRIVFLVVFLFLVFCIIGQYFPAIFPRVPAIRL